MIVILHNIRSLHNVGSIFRTADAVGVGPHTKRALAPKAQKQNTDARYGVGVYLCGVTPSPVDEFGKLRPQFAKVALGAEKYIKWQKVKSTTKLIDDLKGQGYKIFAIEQSKKAIPYHKVKLSRPKKGSGHSDGVRDFRIVLILGSEVKGLPAPVLKKADKILEIPMAGALVRQAHHPRRTRRGKESLNVAVAFGIVAYGVKYKGQK